MIHIGSLAVKTEVFVLLCSLFVMFCQLILCFKVKLIYLRIAPAVLLIAATVILLLMAYTAEGWDGLGYLVLALFALCLLVFCGVGWLIWAIVNALMVRKRKKRDKADPEDAV